MLDECVLISIHKGKATRTRVLNCEALPSNSCAIFKLNLVNLISGILLLSVSSWFTPQTSDYDVIINICINSPSLILTSFLWVMSGLYLTI